MAKQTGLGDNFFIAGYNLSGDVGSVDAISSPMGVLEATAINKSAVERLPGLRDGMVEFSTYFNPTALQEHAALKTLPRTDTVVTYARGTTIGNPSAAMVGKQIDYAPSRGDDGSLVFKVSAQANGFGLDWGRQVTAGVRSDTTATNGAALDLGTGTLSFGLQAYLQVFSFTGTSVTIKLQGSSDNGADAYADITGGAFTTVTARTSERIQTSRTLAVERFIRVVTTGTFSQCSFAVMVNRNTAAVSY